jgi:hypothetical protein
MEVRGARGLEVHQKSVVAFQDSRSRWPRADEYADVSRPTLNRWAPDPFRRERGAARVGLFVGGRCGKRQPVRYEARASRSVNSSKHRA